MWPPKETEPYRAVRHMAAQYRQAMGHVIEQEGGVEEFMQFIAHTWRLQDRLKDELRGRKDREAA